MFAALVSCGFAVAEASAASVALVCDGEFRFQRESVEGMTEVNFDGTMHVALVAEEDSVVEVRLQTFEDGTLTPVQTFALPPAEEPPMTGDMAVLFPELAAQSPADKPDSAATEIDVTPGTLTIDTTDQEVVLRHVVESGPIIKARAKGRPLVPTREKVETIEMRLDRSSGDMNLVWGKTASAITGDPARSGSARCSSATRNPIRPPARRYASVPSEAVPLRT